MATNTSVQAYRNEAYGLQAAAAQKGETMGHCAALEEVAHRHGYRNWRTLLAHLAKRATTGAACQALATRPQASGGDPVSGVGNGPSFSEIKIIQSFPEEAVKELLIWHNEMYPAEAVELSCWRTDPKRVIGAILELYRRSKADLPPLGKSEALELLQHVNGLDFSGMSYSSLPDTIAQGLADDSFADWTMRRVTAIPSRQENEEAIENSLARNELSDTEQNRAAQRCAPLKPAQVLALVVAARFWWADREIQAREMKTASFIDSTDRFFNAVPHDRCVK